jgi:membrane-associated protein
VFDWLLDFVGGSAWAYPSIFGIVFTDAFFPVVPGETSVVTGAILASNGELHISLVFLAGMAGAVAGDNFSYLLGRHLSGWADRRLFRSEKSQERRRWACRQLNERGSVIIVASRFIPGGRTAATFSAGALDYPWRRFIAADVVAGALWAGFSAGLGWFGGKSFEESLWKPLGVAAAFAVIVAIAGELYVRFTSKRSTVGAPPDRRE